MKSLFVSADNLSDTPSEILQVGLGARSYAIRIGAAQLLRLGDILSEFAPAKRVAVVTDETVYGLYGAALKEALSDYAVHMLSLIHI